MRVFKFIFVAMLTAGLSAGFDMGAVQAQGFNGPAETPPASFRGNQYIDSRGCIFIRAGFGGQTRWVPRVSRSRKQVCTSSAARPSGNTNRATTRTTSRSQGTIVDPLAGAPVIGGPNVRTTTRAAPAATATRTTRTTTRATSQAAQPQRTTRVVRQVQPQTTTRVIRRVTPSTTTRVVRQQQQQQRIIRRTQPQTVTRVVRQPRATTTTRVVPQSRTTTRTVRRTGNCANASAFSSQFINAGARCGPQDAPARDVVREEVGPQSSNTRVGPASAPRVIAEARELTPPSGYQAAWKDDRLNPYRGVSLVSGKQEMRMVWSDTVPRRLIDPRTGKPVGKRKLGILGF